MENSEERKQWLLSQHWLKDRTKRRQHRTTHGKIDFTRLSKFVGQKWRELPESEKDFYRSVAKADLDRYKEQERNRASKGKNNGAKI
jgi:cation transport regulator ChaB